MFDFFRKRRRRRIASRPFPDAWRAMLEKNVPLYTRLPAADRRELEGHVQVFLAEKRFEGCGGLEITDEIKVTIAAQACLLLLHRQTEYYPHVSSILVYPTAFVAPVHDHLQPGMVLEGEETHLGQAWEDGLVVLSWEDVRFGAADVRDGTNLVLHEFAHQLDMENNATDGAPDLPHRSNYVAWARVLGDEYERLQEDAALDRETVMDKYGAADPAEFFAVATECFFEKPEKFKSDHPDLYDQLRAFYRQDPAALPGRGRDDGESR